MGQYTVRRILFLILGICLIGVSLTFSRIAGFGTDSSSCFVLGISNVTGIQFGYSLIIINIIILIFVVLFERKFFGLGTVINMLFIGIISDVTLQWLQQVTGTELSFFLRCMFMIASVLLLGFSAALYISADLGLAPYDSLGYVLVKITKKQGAFRWFRIATDVLCVIGGYFMGAVIGINTVILALSLGPLIQFFREHYTDEWMIQKQTKCLKGMKKYS